MIHFCTTAPVDAQAYIPTRPRSSTVTSILLQITPRRRVRKLERRDLDVYFDTPGEFAGAAGDTHGARARTWLLRRTRYTLFLLRFILGLVVVFSLKLRFRPRPKSRLGMSLKCLHVVRSTFWRLRRLRSPRRPPRYLPRRSRRRQDVVSSHRGRSYCHRTGREC
jgi:hypothetical protein